MENRRGNFSEHESACARVAVQFPQRWLLSYVRSKLRHDPIYPTAYELFHLSDEPILDIGCGIGLLAFYLVNAAAGSRSAGSMSMRENPAEATSPPRYRNVDLRRHDIQGTDGRFLRQHRTVRCLHYLAGNRPLLAR